MAAMEQGAILVRRAHFRDADALASFYAALSPESRAMRFMGATQGITADQALAFATAHVHGSDGFVALERATGTIVGHICLAPLRPGVEEVGVAVADAFQRRGVGRALLRAAVGSARRRGMTTLEARMLPGNHAIHGLLQRSGIPWRRRPSDAGAEILSLDLAAAAAA
jgi:RimJ/RimL family protein N-acetyltransferase